MEGLKEAIEFITNLKEGSMEPKVLEINGNTYCNKNLTRYHYFPKADSLSVNTLTSIVDYIKGKPEELRETMILHVISPTEVRLYSGLVDERNREELMRADAIVNEFQFDRYYDQERFLIELQANFIEKSELRIIFRLYFLDDLSYPKVADQMNKMFPKRRIRYTDENIKKKIQRYFENVPQCPDKK